MKLFLKSCIQTFTNKPFYSYLILACFLLLTLFLVSISSGASKLSFRDTWNYILFQKGNTFTHNILLYVRLPRSIAAMICGSSLALAGLLLQAVLNNALASSSTIGVNAGAGLFVVLAGLLFPGTFFMKPIFAFIGSLTTALLVFLIAKKSEVTRGGIILIGIAIASFFSAISDSLITLFPDRIFDKTTFFIGGFAHVQIQSVLFLLPFMLFCFLLVILLSSNMNILSLGDEVANSLGLHVTRYRFTLLILAATLAGIGVSIGGVLSFVGLIIPHTMRMITGNNYRKLVPLTFFYGAILVLLCDVLSRIIFAPYEVSVGILLSFLGAPFFLYIVLTKKRRLQI